MGFPETSPQTVCASLSFVANALLTTEVILLKTKKLGTVTDTWAMTDAAAGTVHGLEVYFMNRGTGFAGTATISSLGASASASDAWGATTPKAGTVANNTDIAANSYISVKATRATAGTATAIVLSVGAVFVPGKPAAVGSIGA